LPQEPLDQRQHATVADALLYLPQQPFVPNAVEVRADVRIHHPHPPALEVLIDLTQSVLAAALWSKPVAGVVKLTLEDRLDHHLERALHDAVFDRRYPQRSYPARRFRNLDPSHRLRSIGVGTQRLLQLRQIPLGIEPKNRSCREQTVGSVSVCAGWG
jgi:hypothetical protein